MTGALFLAGPPDTAPPLGNQDGVGRRQIRGRVTAEDELAPDRPRAHRRGCSLRPPARDSSRAWATIPRSVTPAPPARPPTRPARRPRPLTLNTPGLSPPPTPPPPA